MSRTLAIAVVSLGLLLSACGGSNEASENEPGFDEVLAAVANLDGKARTEKLRQLAEREGAQVDFYSSVGSDTVAKLVDEFEDLYDIHVAVYRADGDAVLARLLEEERAGFRGSDVVQLNGLAMTALREEELLFPYASPARRNLAAGAVNGGWTASHAPSFVVSWNTKLVRPGEQPDSWEDLADARWKGRLAIEASDVDWFKTLRDYWIEEEGKTAAEADRLFDAIGRNAIVVSGHTVEGQLHAAGEFELAVNYAARVDLLAAEGAPLAWRPPIEPLIVQSTGIGLMRNARHPAAALLFVDFVLGPGQEILAEDHRDPMRKDLLVERSAKRVTVDYASLSAEQEQWTKAYERVLGLGRKAPE